MRSPSSIAVLVSTIGIVLAGLSSPLTANQTAQTPARQAPPRDASAAPAKGTGVMRGRIVAADTGRPLRRARVTISAPQLGSESRRTTSTNIDGRFEFTELPAARYRVSVTRGGYLPLDYGQRRPGEQGRPVQVSDAQVVEKIDFSLPRMGLITGRITDEAGEPIEGVSVYAMRLLYFEGRRRLVPVGSITTTDDVGEYRLLRLAPGSYFVMASTKETWTVTEDGKETVFGYMPTYFPGVTKGAEARRVTLGTGQEAGATDISLVPGRAPKVSGQAVDSQGKPFTRVDLSEEVRGIGFASFRQALGSVVAADGTFTIANVPPGEYTLTARRPADSPEGGPEVALMPLAVETTDIENLMLVGSSGGTISGRLIVEGTSPPKMSEVRVNAVEPLRNQPSPAILGTFRDRSGSSPVKEDGTFSVPHVFGRARFNVTVPDGWMLKAVMHGGRDITEEPIELRSGEPLSGVEVVITDQVTSIGGQLLDQKNAPIQDATVLVFPSDAEKWFENARRIRAARPDQQGQWQVKGLPAGEYLAIALDYIEDGAWHDPEYLGSLRRDARAVALADGGTETVPLKVGVSK